MPSLRAPIPWLWEFLSLKMKFVVDDSGHGIPLPLASSLAFDALSVERPSHTRGGHAVGINLPCHVVDVVLLIPIRNEHPVGVDIPTKE